MSFCSNCGNKLNPENKFCSSCGNKIENISSNSINKIDDSINKVLGGIGKVANEIGNSEYVNKSVEVTRKKASSTKELLIKVLAFIGLIVLFGQFLVYLILDKNISLVYEYQDVFKYNYSHSSFEKIFIYIARILPSTILPLLFMYLYGKRVEWINYFLGFGIVFLFLTTLNPKPNAKEHVSFIEDDIDNGVVEAIDSSYVDNSIISNEIIFGETEEKDIKYLKNNFSFNNVNYSYEFECENDVWGNTVLNIFKGDDLIFTEEYIPYHCSIYNIELIDNFFCYEIHTVGGTNGMESYSYYAINLINKKDYEAEKYFPIGEPNNYYLNGLDEIIDMDEDAYIILKEK